ncbi:uridine phosphorylase [Flavobacteriaceae bacterium MAR_2010_188]|nr:uridine phosphorylase [Flavobacteriaceae bacterium MAR_2010_188]
MPLPPSELILNDDGSIYHLNLLPQDIADAVITVGDQDRVEKITKHFKKIEVSKRKREFFTQTGTFKNKRITVISTGIGTDNIDIVINELDALVNIDLEKRQVKPNLKSLDIIRIGTSGSIQSNIPIDSFLISDHAIGFDSLLHYYNFIEDESIEGFSEELVKHLNLDPAKSKPYIVGCDEGLKHKFTSDKTVEGITVTNVGFYGPQGRVLRLKLKDEDLNDKLSTFNFEGKKITNLEMETAGIYGLSKLLGHRAVSMNAIIANRATKEFSKDSEKTIDSLILYTLEKLSLS